MNQLIRHLVCTMVHGSHSLSIMTRGQVIDYKSNIGVSLSLYIKHTFLARTYFSCIECRGFECCDITLSNGGIITLPENI